MAKAILFVLTAQTALGETGAKTGVWLEELAMPYRMLTSAGYEVLFGTPGGLPAQIDPASLDDPWLLPAGYWFLKQKGAVAQLQTPLDLANLAATQFEAIYLVGGTGTLWDFPGCIDLGQLASEMIALDKPVAAICHGVVGLASARSPDDTPLVSGKALTCFSNAEETMLEYDKIVPVLAETVLVGQGAIYQSAAPFEPKIVEDGRLITGQNPASAEPLTKALLKQLGHPNN